MHTEGDSIHSIQRLGWLFASPELDMTHAPLEKRPGLFASFPVWCPNAKLGGHHPTRLGRVGNSAVQGGPLSDGPQGPVRRFAPHDHGKHKSRHYSLLNPDVQIRPRYQQAPGQQLLVPHETVIRLLTVSLSTLHSFCGRLPPAELEVVLFFCFL